MSETVMPLQERKYVVKITLSMQNRLNVERVLYYRRQLPFDLKNKYEWYFELLAAKAKIAFPKRKVEMLIIEDTMPTTEEYVATKTKTMLSAKKGQIKKLETEQAAAISDLFGFEYAHLPLLQRKSKNLLWI